MRNESNKRDGFSTQSVSRYFLRTSWTTLIIGVFIISGYILFEMLTDEDVTAILKIGVGMFYAGLFFLFLNVLRQRLKEKKTDKYKDVEI